MENKETQREIEIITRLLDLNNERFLLFYRSSKQMLKVVKWLLTLRMMQKKLCACYL